MATAAYITTNAPNDNAHMEKLQVYTMEGIQVLQTGGAAKPTRDPAQRRPTGVAQQHQSQATAPTIAPRPQGVQPINRELRHTLVSNKVDWAGVQHENRRVFDSHDSSGNGPSIADIKDDELCSAERFSLYILTTPLPTGLKISENIAKFNGQ
jgi:hypothetical protein